MNSNKITTRTAEIWKDEHDIIHMLILNNVSLDLDDVIDNILVLRNFTQDAPRLKFVDSRNSWTITIEAKKFSEKADSAKRTIARAILVSNKTDAVLKNFLMKFNQPDIPSKLFTESEKAMEWLLSFKK